MNYFLVDAENINVSVISKHVSKKDNIVYFYTAQCCKIPAEFIEQLNEVNNSAIE